MLYILPNPGGKRRKSGFRRKGKIVHKGPGLPLRLWPPVFRPGARRAHPPSKTRGRRKIQKALGKGKWYRHRPVTWSRHPRGGDEGVRTPYYVRGNRMARTRSRRRRKYGRRRRHNPLVRAHRRRRASRRRRSRRNPYVLGNSRRRRRRKSRSRRRRNPFQLVLGNRPRRRRRRSRRSRRSRRNPYVLGNRPRRSRRRRSSGRRRRGLFRRNPNGITGAISKPFALLSPRTFIASAKGLALTAIPVAAGFGAHRLLDKFLYYEQLQARLVQASFFGNASPTVQNLMLSGLHTFTHLVTASVGGGLIGKVWRRADAAKLFAAGVALSWVQKMALLWMPEGSIKQSLMGYDDLHMSDYVEAAPYALQNGVSDYGEGSLKDYVEHY